MAHLKKSFLALGIISGILFGTEWTGNCQAQETFGLQVTGDFVPLGSFISASEQNHIWQVHAKNEGGKNQLVVVKIQKNGEIIWARKYSGEGNKEPSFIASFPDGGLLITGIHENGINFSMKVAPDGNVEWAADYGFVMNTMVSFYPYNNWTDDKGNAFVFGFYSNGTDPQLYLIKISPKGDLLWSRNLGAGTMWGYGNKTQDGGALICHSSKLLKIDGDGNKVWAKSLTGSLSHSLRPMELSDGSFYLPLTNTHLTEFIPLKFSKDGELLWVGESPSKGLQIPQIKEVEIVDDKLIACGRFPIGDFAPEYRPCLIRFDRNGKVEKINTYWDSSGGSPNYFFMRMDKDPRDRIFVSGVKAGSPARSVVFKMEKDLEVKCGVKGDVVSSPGGNIQLSDLSLDVAENFFKKYEFTLDVEVVNAYSEEFCYSCQKPDIGIEGETALCEGDTLVLTATGEFARFRWSTGQDTRQISVWEGGDYQVNGIMVCGEDSLSVTVNLSPAIVFDFSVSPDSTSPFEEIKFSDNSPNARERLWVINDSIYSTEAYFTRRFPELGEYRVQLRSKNEGGCEYSDSTTFLINYSSLFIPNAFSPNSDGHNDVFDISGYGVEDYTLTIFNRWGQQIFDGRNSGWNGDDAPIGLYFYRIVLINSYGENVYRDGWVNLLR